jgi:predicted nucleic acid-binding protein
LTFVDSSFWIAVYYPRDRWHSEAVALLERHPRDLVTSNHVRGETWTFLRRRLGHSLGTHFLDRLDSTGTTRVVFVERELEREALDWLRRHDERPYSFVDATSFALMRSLGITQALAFDGDFAAAGFEELRTGD